MNIQEFHGSEPVTAVIKLDLDTGEQYQDPIVIGHYGPQGGGEVWIEQDGHRVQFAPRHFAAVIKQLKRALKIAQEVSES